jgi:CheY-like chemotaxis protein
MNKEATSPLILIADDQPDVLEALRMLLKTEGYRIETASSLFFLIYRPIIMESSGVKALW